MKESKNFMCKYWWLILIIFLIPIIIWGLTLIQTPYMPKGYLIDERDWLSFFGGYLGSCITILITLYILRITTNQNHNSLSKTLQMSINAARFTDANNEIATIRKVLDDNYRLLDYQRFIKALVWIKIRNYNIANQLLLDITHDVEMVASSSDIYLKAYNDNKSKAEEHYFDVFEELLSKFGVLVNDFNFITTLPDFISKHDSVEDIYTYIDFMYQKLQELSSLSEKVKMEYKSDNNFFALFLKKPRRETKEELLEDIDDATTKRLMSVLNEYSNKNELLDVTKEFLKFKEAEADKILTDKL